MIHRLIEECYTAIAKECVTKECDSGSKESENEETQVEILATRFEDCEEPSFLKD